MTQSARIVFVTQLSRAAARHANRFLRARGLQEADRDDVIAAAMLWCWENRDKYSLTTTLETWFMNAIRDAYKSLRGKELPPSAESIENMGGGDTTYDTAAAESAVAAVLGALTVDHKRVARLTMHGYTRAEMEGCGISKRVVDEAHQRIRQLRKLLPATDVGRLIARTMPRAPSDDVDDRLSGIDRDLEKLDFAPPAGKDCPPCWRCMWFEGFMPDGKRSTRLDIVDAEVSEAVRSTEARKIEIARRVRSGA